MTIEEKLAALARCGLKLKDQFSMADLEESWGREALDEPGWDLVLVCLGMTQEEPPWTPHCDILWHFDSECIEDDGDYIKIAKRMMEMTQGSLVFSDIEDHVDIETGEAWLHFKCHGDPIHITCEVQDDWVDLDLFSRFVELLEEYDPGKIFIHHDLGGQGQDCIIGCVTREQFASLQKLIPAMQPLA